MYDVITLGSATVDAFAKTSSQLIKIFDNRGETDLVAFPAGSKLLINELHYKTGGGGTNTAVAFRRLGHSVAYVGKIGKGYNGSRIIKALEDEGVRTHLIRRGQQPSGFSIILDDPHQKDRAILAHKGINDHFRVRDVRLTDLDTRWIYCSSLTGEARGTLQKVSRYAARKGIRFAFNPSSYMTKQGLEPLRDVLRNTTVLVFNMEEAQQLTGKDSPNRILRTLHEHGPSIVVITEGKKGAYASDGKSIYHAKPPRATVTDTTGAGDAFAASFVSGLIRAHKDDPLPQALRMGLVNSSNVVQYVGAKDGLLTSRTLETELGHKAIRVKKETLS